MSPVTAEVVWDGMAGTSANAAFDPARTGYVFNVQRYTLHDGPGIRTLVFLNGCPLRCAWCCNPESQQLRPQLALNADKCIGTGECGRCLQVCAPGAITSAAGGRVSIERARCDLCFRCIPECPSEALHAFGMPRTVDEVLAAVEADGIFFGRSGGGLTLSGGEPLVQGDFAVSLLRAARNRKIDTAIETCGHVDWRVLSEAARWTNTVIFDVKSTDAGKHAQFTGVDNALILANLRRLLATSPRPAVVVRTPLIPGFNDSVEEIAAIIDFLTEVQAARYEVLPYHRLGTPKYEYLGRRYPMGNAALDPATERRIKELVKKFGVSKQEVASR
jgi:pyruvate formate lyase activating enzyme